MEPSFGAVSGLEINHKAAPPSQHFVVGSQCYSTITHVRPYHPPSGSGLPSLPPGQKRLTVGILCRLW
jgi:hypothetical protein